MEETYVVKSSYPDDDIPEDISMPDFVLKKAAQYGDRAAFIDEVSGRTLTYTWFVNDCYKLAAGLYQHGVRKGDIVATYLDNCIEFPVINHAIMLCGGVMTGLITALLDHEQLPVIRNADPKYIFASVENVKNIKKLTNDCPTFECMFVIGESTEEITYLQLISNDLEAPKVKINSRVDPGYLTYTSGTTGERKGVLSPQWSLMVPCIHQERAPEIAFYDDGTDVTLMVRLITHTYGQVCYTSVGPYFGVTCVLLLDYSIPGILKAVEKYKVTVLALTPLPIAQMAKYEDRDKYDTSSLRRTMTTGAPMSETVRERFTAILKVPVFMQGFGMSEVVFTHVTPRGYHGNSVGVLLPNSQAQIVDIVNHRPVGPGINGELWVKGPCRFSYYLKNPNATIEAITEDGWVKTGDIGHYDEDKYFYIVDRLKEMIDTDACKIAPAEVEAIIMGHAGIAEVCVVGYPDEDYGELPRAYVVKKSGSEVTAEDVAQLVIDRGHSSMRLTGGVRFIAELPKSILGKVLRKTFKAQMLREEKCSVKQ